MKALIWGALCVVVLILGVVDYTNGSEDQRKHDQRCLATDASWADVSRCIG